mmetsp:Transcript_11157/g.20070  ORF Transcript_11157/g.20070 Transcript_11157/m.20070 type:complete len:347 (+) Transcript_11157:260-1300(+)
MQLGWSSSLQLLSSMMIILIFLLLVKASHETGGDFMHKSLRDTNKTLISVRFAATSSHRHPCKHQCTMLVKQTSSYAVWQRVAIIIHQLLCFLFVVHSLWVHRILQYILVYVVTPFHHKILVPSCIDQLLPYIWHRHWTISLLVISILPTRLAQLLHRSFHLPIIQIERPLQYLLVIHNLIAKLFTYQPRRLLRELLVLRILIALVHHLDRRVGQFGRYDLLRSADCMLGRIPILHQMLIPNHQYARLLRNTLQMKLIIKIHVTSKVSFSSQCRHRPHLTHITRMPLLGQSILHHRFHNTKRRTIQIILLPPLIILGKTSFQLLLAARTIVQKCRFNTLHRIPYSE